MDHMFFIAVQKGYYNYILYIIHVPFIVNHIYFAQSSDFVQVLSIV